MDTVGGYRLIRELGSGTRARVYLGNAVSGAPDAPDRVAIKVYRSTTQLSDIDAEIEALGRASSPHLLRLIDLGTAPDARPCLIVQRLGTRGLARLIADRASIAAGEAVTVLAPITEAVTELHRVGVVHGNIRPAAILFDDAGSPVLTGFGRAGLVGAFPEEVDGYSLTAAQLADEPRVVADLEQLRTLCRTVLGHVARPTEAVEDILNWLESDWLESRSPQRDIDSFGPELVERLFDLAPALPVALSPGAATVVASPKVPARLAGTVLAGTAGGRLGLLTPEDDRSGPRHLSATSRLARLALPPAVEGMLARVRVLVARVRRPVWIGAGIGVASLVLALLVLPSGTGSARGGALRSEAVKTATPAPASDPAVTADDAVAAARTLFGARAQCLSERSVLCLDAVDQPDSSAMDADRHLVQSAEDVPGGGSAPVGVDAAALVERLGDSALVTLTLDQPDSAPVAVLIVKGDAGWRIRDVLVG